MSAISQTPSQSAPPPPLKRASTSGTGKRPSATTTSSAPKPPLNASSRAIVAAHVNLVGTHQITLAPKCVLHPYSKISSREGPIILGEGCVVWEKAVIGSLEDPKSPSSDHNVAPHGITLGKHVVIESMATVQAKEVGEGTRIESGAKIGRACVIGKHCTVTAHSVLPPNTVLPDYTIIFGGAQQRLNTTLRHRPDVRELVVQAHEKMLDGLTLLIPNNLSKWQ